MSRLAGELDAKIAEFRNRPLDAGPYRYLWIDALERHEAFSTVPWLVFEAATRLDPEHQNTLKTTLEGLLLRNGTKRCQPRRQLTQPSGAVLLEDAELGGESCPAGLLSDF